MYTTINNRIAVLLLVLLIPFITTNAQEAEETEPAFEFGLSYTGDLLYNFSGGLKQGGDYLGLAELDLSLNTEAAKLWKGGTFFLKASNTHGGVPSETLIGDIQVVSNIEAGKHTYLQEFWYKQNIKNVEIIVGLQDLNVEITRIAYGELFVHSSFGVLPIIALNLEAPIFPLTSLGITTKWNINENMSWLNAIYDGTPTDFDDNPYNLKWDFRQGDGILFVSEFQNSFEVNNLPAIYKFGVFAHDHVFERTFISDFPDSLNTNTAGIYINYEQKMWRKGQKDFDAFIHSGYSPSEMSVNHFYLGMGINASGFLSKSGNDVIGLAGNYTKLQNGMGHETIFELTWKRQIGEYFFIQPDLQYIIHPAGSGKELKNALVGILRFGIEI